jgi:hypothetical protein
MAGEKGFAVRIPSWCKNYTVSAEYETENGYAYVILPAVTALSFLSKWI